MLLALALEFEETSSTVLTATTTPFSSNLISFNDCFFFSSKLLASATTVPSSLKASPLLNIFQSAEGLVLTGVLEVAYSL